ncbi:YdeI/OmpD-associated family protein [Bacillus sp. H-16]|uniref:YdeI/OmpD-associated family protein n=1 Tax=Alteribacter salitolerans TaxID=2912333 RepID=UPI0019634376|nr:YdeI/OmpD-associated family protein [Alteribacter salitolerans]MBM7095215.1 YdeI/OmpD-associated family protein [Alteribacter salitolerans]
MAKSIVEKLNLKKYKSPAIIHLPDGEAYFDGLETYETELTPGSSYDLIFAFTLDMPSLQKMVRDVIEHQYLKKGGYLFIAYPKKGNKRYPAYIHRDDLFEGVGADEKGRIGTSTITFSRMVSLDETFTVVGFKDDSPKKSANRASQCVDDYIEQIPDIEKDLEQVPDVLQFYQSLTPGYRKDWARFVYSAKQEKTREKRREEMKAILSDGHKSRDLYMRAVPAPDRKLPKQ